MKRNARKILPGTIAGVCLIWIIIFSCFRDSFQIKITEDLPGAYGYQILLDDQVKIDQPFIPAVSHKTPFASEQDAKKTAEYVLQKIKQKEDFSITKSELVRLGISIHSNP